MIALVPFLFGTILGSFINALSFRYNSGRSMMGRSACTSCGKALGAHELIPVLSFVLQRGRCRGCKSRISLQYPLVEVTAGVLVGVASTQFPGEPVLLAIVVAYFMTLLFLAVYDIRHTVLPDGFVYAAGVLALVYTTLIHGAQGILSSMVAGASLALPLFFIWLISRGRAMGLGDAKLMVASGIFLGLSAGAAALLLAFWIGALWGIGLLLIARASRHRGGVTMKSEIPFGPFIVLGTGLSYFLHVSLTSLIGSF